MTLKYEVPQYTAEQEAAMKSHAMCVCGHKEMFHMIPCDDELRECFPPHNSEPVDWDMETGEPIYDDDGCACKHFQEAT